MLHPGRVLVSWLQVLNMKPPEILGMLEEAAGTRMYENKKDAALRTLEKKQVKVAEIEKVGGACFGSILSQGCPKTACTVAQSISFRPWCRKDQRCIP